MRLTSGPWIRNPMGWALPLGFGFHYRICIAADSPKADIQIGIIRDN